MIWRPKPNQVVEIRYSASLRKVTGLHGETGTVITAGNARGLINGKAPINALIKLVDGRLVVVPRGQLFLLKEEI